MGMTKELKANIARVAVGLFAVAALSIAVMAFTPYFNYTAVTGALLGALGATLNFFFLALAVSKAVTRNEKGASAFVQATYAFRLLFMGAVIVLALLSPYFNGYLTIIPFIFMRPIIMAVNAIFNKNPERGTDFSKEPASDTDPSDSENRK